MMPNAFAGANQEIGPVDPLPQRIDQPNPEPFLFADWRVHTHLKQGIRQKPSSWACSFQFLDPSAAICLPGVMLRGGQISKDINFHLATLKVLA